MFLEQLPDIPRSLYKEDVSSINQDNNNPDNPDKPDYLLEKLANELFNDLR